VYSGKPPKNSTWRTKEKKKGTIWGNVGKCYGCKREFLPAVPPDHVPYTLLLEKSPIGTRKKHEMAPVVKIESVNYHKLRP